MRIAQIAPLFESVPPERYGGTERVVHYLTEELVRRGHEVTLYASGDSRTSAELVACSPRALRLGMEYTDASAFEVAQLERVFAEASRYDVLHFHTGHMHYPVSRRLGVPHVTTLHGRLDLPELAEMYRVFADVPVVSISDAQRSWVPHACWQATVYHGLPPTLYRKGPGGDYFAFVGRISPEKRVDRAIEIAKRTGVRLLIAAKVDKVDREYYEQIIRPLMDHPLVEFVGDVNDEGKQSLLGGARALLFPVDWPEPFGLSMIEAMACGTPVIAWREGSVPEVIFDERAGLIVESMEEAVAAAERVHELDRDATRACFERGYLASRMAEDYERVYRRLMMDGRRDAGTTSDERLVRA